jgi:hypothetical protein
MNIIYYDSLSIFLLGFFTFNVFFIFFLVLIPNNKIILIKQLTLLYSCLLFLLIFWFFSELYINFQSSPELVNSEWISTKLEKNKGILLYWLPFFVLCRIIVFLFTLTFSAVRFLFLFLFTNILDTYDKFFISAEGFNEIYYSISINEISIFFVIIIICLIPIQIIWGWNSIINEAEYWKITHHIKKYIISLLIIELWLITFICSIKFHLVF